MSASHSISVWIDRFRASDQEAARVLWERFFDRMVAIARRRLGPGPRRAADEEDVAVKAFTRFHQAVLAGRFPLLHDRNDLWAVLLTLTERTAASQVRHELRQKRGGGDIRGDSALRSIRGTEIEPQTAEPTPEESALLRDELARLLELLDDDQLRQIAVGKMEGYTNAELACQLGCSAVTIERRLRLIRETWQQVIEG